jgi:hypothetical protein
MFASQHKHTTTVIPNKNKCCFKRKNIFLDEKLIMIGIEDAMDDIGLHLYWGRRPRIRYI